LYAQAARAMRIYWRSNRAPICRFALQIRIALVTFGRRAHHILSSSRSMRMKRRIFLWALLGSSVASLWVLYVVATAPNSSLTHSIVLAITAPASLLGRSMPQAYYTFILLNGCFYALIALATQLLRKGSHLHDHPSHH
jgi:hypothetical protein